MKHRAAPLALRFSLLLAVVLAACGRPPSQATLTVETTPTATQAVPTHTQTAAPTHTPTQKPTASPEPSATFNPTTVPTPEPNLPAGAAPVVTAGPILSPANAAQVVELAGWGEGYEFELNLKTILMPSAENAQIVPNGQVLATVEKLGSLPDISAVVRTRFWGLPSGELLHEIFDPQGYETIHFSPDGSLYVLRRGVCPNEAGDPCSVEVWSYPQNEQVLSLDVDFTQPVAAISPDNRRLVLSAREGVQLWDLGTGELVHTLPESLNLTNFRFSDDSTLLAGFMQVGEQVQVWQVETGELLATLKSEPYGPVFYPSALDFSPAFSPAFSPGDTRLAVGFNSMIEYWQVSGWREGMAWMANNSVIQKLTFSPDGKLLASGAEDGSLTLSDAATGEVLVNLVGHSYFITDLAFSPDGKLLISVALDGTLRFWGIPQE